MRKPPTAEQRAASMAKRAQLIARSVPIQKARKAGVLPWAELETVNACLELIYSRETGQTAWSNFHGWKEQGFAVSKGEKGFAIWGRPLGVKIEGSESTEAAPAEGGEGGEAASFSYFPLAYIFHAGQVADAAGQRPTTYREPAAVDCICGKFHAGPCAEEPPAEVIQAPTVADLLDATQAA